MYDLLINFVDTSLKESEPILYTQLNGFKYF